MPLASFPPHDVFEGSSDISSRWVGPVWGGSTWTRGNRKAGCLSQLCFFTKSWNVLADRLDCGRGPPFPRRGTCRVGDGCLATADGASTAGPQQATPSPHSQIPEKVGHIFPHFMQFTACARQRVACCFIFSLSFVLKLSHVLLQMSGPHKGESAGRRGRAILSIMYGFSLLHEIHPLGSGTRLLLRDADSLISWSGCSAWVLLHTAGKSIGGIQANEPAGCSLPRHCNPHCPSSPSRQGTAVLSQHGGWQWACASQCLNTHGNLFPREVTTAQLATDCSKIVTGVFCRN